MATIIENRTAEPMNRSILVDGSSEDSGAGWAVAVLILVVAIIVGAFWYMRSHTPAAVGTTPSTIQVNVPSNTQPSGGAPANTQTTQTPATTNSAPAAPATAPVTQ